MSRLLLHVVKQAADLLDLDAPVIKSAQRTGAIGSYPENHVLASDAMTLVEDRVERVCVVMEVFGITLADIEAYMQSKAGA